MRIEDSGLRVQVSGRGVHVLGLMVWGLRLKFDGSGLRGKIPACRHQKTAENLIFNSHEHLDLLTLTGQITRWSNDYCTKRGVHVTKIGAEGHLGVSWLLIFKRG